MRAIDWNEELSSLVSIVIPAHNQLEYCRQCILTVQQNTRKPYQLILVDNGSTDGVSEFFDEVPGAIVVHTEKNLGFAGGMNRGLAHASGHVVWLNNDTLTPAGWLEPLEGALLRDARLGMVGPRSNYASGVQQIDGLNFNSMDEINAYAAERAALHAGVTTPTERLVGFCVLVRDVAAECVGMFDERFGVGNYEDDDYCARMRAAGYGIAVAEDAFVFHYGGRTFASMGYTDDKWRSLMEDNRRRFIEKWRAIDEERARAAQQLADAGREAYRRGNIGSAVGLYRQAIEARPDLGSNYNDVGVILWELGDREKAFEYFKRAVSLEPEHAAARKNLEDCAAALGRGEEARELLEE